MGEGLSRFRRETGGSSKYLWTLSWHEGRSQCGASAKSTIPSGKAGYERRLGRPLLDEWRRVRPGSFRSRSPNHRLPGSPEICETSGESSCGRSSAYLGSWARCESSFRASQSAHARAILCGHLQSVVNPTAGARTIGPGKASQRVRRSDGSSWQWA